MPIAFEYNDGGRAQAGYKGQANDCVVRAIAIATEQPYKKVYKELHALNRKNNGRYLGGRNPSPRNAGTAMRTIKEYLAELGWKWTPTMGIGTGCTVHLHSKELPAGRIIVRVSKHMAAVIDGVVHDTYQPDRDGSRAVYGYFTK